jgi:hypothetical protein
VLYYYVELEGLGLWCLMPLFTTVLYYYVELEGLGLWCLMPLFTTVLYYYVELEGLGLWCLMPLFTIFQLYRGSLVYWWRTSVQLYQPLFEPSHILVINEGGKRSREKLTLNHIIVLNINLEI